MTKYLFYTENYFFGGGNRYMFDLINFLKKDSNKISLYCNYEALHNVDIKKTQPRIHLKYIKIFHLNMLKDLILSNKFIRRFIYLISTLCEPFLILLNTLLFISKIVKESPDQIIVCNGGYPAATSCLSMVFASKICRVPAIMSIVSMPLPRRKFISFYDRFLDCCVWASVKLIIVNCNAIKNSLNVSRNLPNNKVQVAYSAIEDRPRSSPNIFKKKHVTIGCVSRMDLGKGVVVLLEAFRDIKKTHKFIKLLLVGQGDASSVLEGKIKEYGLEKDVILYGFYNGDILKLIHEKIDIFVLPSFWEGLPYSIIEAMSASKPIVSTAVGGIPEVIKNRVTGILVKTNSVIALKKGIKILLDNKKLSRRLAVNARARFEKDLTMNCMHKCIESIFAGN